MLNQSLKIKICFLALMVPQRIFNKHPWILSIAQKVLFKVPLYNELEY